MNFWITHIAFIALIWFGFFVGIDEARYVVYAWSGVLFFAGSIVFFAILFFADNEHYKENTKEIVEKAKPKYLRLSASIIVSAMLAMSGHYILAMFYFLLVYVSTEALILSHKE